MQFRGIHRWDVMDADFSQDAHIKRNSGPLSFTLPQTATAFVLGLRTGKHSSPVHSEAIRNRCVPPVTLPSDGAQRDPAWVVMDDRSSSGVGIAAWMPSTVKYTVEPADRDLGRLRRGSRRHRCAPHVARHRVIAPGSPPHAVRIRANTRIGIRRIDDGPADKTSLRKMIAVPFLMGFGGTTSAKTP